MDLLPTESLFSRQGKATTHMHPEFATGPKRRPEAKVIEPVKMSDLKAMLADIEQNRTDEENAVKNRPNPLTSSFRAISRDSYAFAFRNRTDSPKVGNYSPRFTVVEPRATHTLQLKSPVSAPKQRIIYLPSCVDPKTADLHNRRHKSTTNKVIKRNAFTLHEFSSRLGDIESKYLGEVKKTGERLILPMDFDKQKPREDFVKNTDPPNENRFAYMSNYSEVHSNQRRVSSLPFEKILPRKEFFDQQVSLSPYDVKKELTQKKVSITVLEFSKMTPRKPLIHDHMIKTPQRIEDGKIEAAYTKQSTVRGFHKLPLMQTITARDDIMYRTTESYNLNVPERQSAFAAPKFMGFTATSFNTRGYNSLMG